ncbi:hypothetical protein TNCV_3134211 [Trichonephila clavipes]|nr:hypothetical protein TNCV_3134211 [Trichonephila clavipes]
MANQFGENSHRNSRLTFIQLGFNLLQRVRSLVGRSSAYYAGGYEPWVASSLEHQTAEPGFDFRSHQIPLYTHKQNNETDTVSTKKSSADFGGRGYKNVTKLSHASLGLDSRVDVMSRDGVEIGREHIYVAYTGWAKRP